MLMLLLGACGALAGLLVSEITMAGLARGMAMVSGGAIGVLWALVVQQGRRITDLEQHLKPLSDPVVELERESAPSPAKPEDSGVPASAPPAQVEPEAAGPARSSPQQIRPPPRPSPSSSAVWKKLWPWFTEGNVPVRVGVLVSFVGVAALLRYVSEQGWLTAPIEVRLAAVAAVAVAALMFGWRQTRQRRIFALSLQGGAIGVLLMTIFAASELYGVLPTGAAFVLVVTLVGAGGMLAIAHNAAGLAILAMVAGFTAPLLLSSGQGNHLALFSWYAVLNLAVFAVAWVRGWPLLNRLGFLFTFGIGTFWGVLRWTPEHYLSAQLFLLLFFVLYLIIPMLESRRRKGSGVDVLLVFGLPLFVLPLQIGLLEGARLEIALFALCGALTYLGAASLLLNRLQARLLGRSYAVLAIGLATLAVPFAFSGPTVTLIWALQGGALVWFGCLQHRRLARLSGLALQLAAAVVWLGTQLAASPASGWAFFSPLGLGGIALSLAATLSAWRYQLAGAGSMRVNLLAAWALLFWTLTGLFEITIRLESAEVANGLVAFFALTSVLGALVCRWRGWTVSGVAPALGLWVCALLVFDQPPLAGWGLAAWVAVVAVVIVNDRLLLAHNRWRLWNALAGHLAVVIMIAVVAVDVARNSWQLDSGWWWLGALAPALLLTAWLLSSRRPPLCVAALPPSAHQGLTAAGVLAVLCGLLVSLAARGPSGPLPWVPIINPLELVQIAALLTLVASSQKSVKLEVPLALTAAAAWLVLSMMALRSVHHLAGIDWEMDALLASHQGQVALSLLWSVIGVAAWVAGSRRHLPMLWWAGALLLGLVLIKLLLVDRQFLSQMAGILSFLAFGLLSMLVGYLAPAPPSRRVQKESLS